MPSTISKEHAAHGVCRTIPHMRTMQGHDGPGAFGHSFTYIGVTISSFLKYLIKDSEWMDLVSRAS